MPVYSDLNQTTPTEKILLTDAESVYQSIANILTTSLSERLFNPEFGCDLDAFLFELMDDLTAAQLYRLVIEAIERWEPRVVLDHSQSDVIADPDNHIYAVKLYFQIIGVRDQGQSFEFLGELTP